MVFLSTHEGIEEDGASNFERVELSQNRTFFRTRTRFRFLLLFAKLRRRKFSGVLSYSFPREKWKIAPQPQSAVSSNEARRCLPRRSRTPSCRTKNPFPFAMPTFSRSRRSFCFNGDLNRRTFARNRRPESFAKSDRSTPSAFSMRRIQHEFPSQLYAEFILDLSRRFSKSSL